MCVIVLDYNRENSLIRKLSIALSSLLDLLMEKISSGMKLDGNLVQCIHNLNIDYTCLHGYAK